MFADILKKVIEYAKSIGFCIHEKNDLDEFYKGDLDGLNIYCAQMPAEEKLFNILHMVGHCIQWGVDGDLKELGSKVYFDPSDELLNELQNYEWEANCYGLYILHKLGVTNLDEWLSKKFEEDIMYLTHFYKTGEKSKKITEINSQYKFTKPLVEKEIPKFTPVKCENTRNGIVIDFN